MMHSVIGKVQDYFFHYKYGEIPEMTCLVKDVVTDEYWICLIEKDDNPEGMNAIINKKDHYNFEGYSDDLTEDLWETLPMVVQMEWIQPQHIKFVKHWNKTDALDMFIF